MAASAGEVSIFADTNLGTRIAMNVPPDITAGAFKRDFERVHFACIPNSGEIQVHGLMVQRKSCFYYLPDSLPLKYVFHGVKKMWFLHVEVRHLRNLHDPCLTQAMATLSKPQDVKNNSNKDKARCNRKEMRREGLDHLKCSPEQHGSVTHILKKEKRGTFMENHMPNAVIGTSEGCSHRLEENSSKSQYIMIENRVENMEGCKGKSMKESEMSSEVISVSGIINKYFPSFNVGSPSCSDVTSGVVGSEVEERSKTNAKSCCRKQFTPRTPPSGKSRSKVGKCVLVASRSLGMSTNKYCPAAAAICVSRYRGGKLVGSQINGSLFEVSDSED